MKKEGKKAVIISIGDELLIGQVVDTNSVWIAKQLELTGVQVVRHWAVPDEEEAISESLNEAIKIADCILLTGGLGPTRDDRTKKVLAAYFGSRLIRNEAASRHIISLFEKTGRALTAENENQALVPDNCIVLQNAVGTAPGMLFEKEGKKIFSLPGVPFEMKAMFLKSVLPRITSENESYCRLHHHFLLANVSETEIAKTILHIENDLPSYIRLAYLPGASILRLRLTGSHVDAGFLKKMMAEFVDRIRSVLQHQIIAEEPLLLEDLLGKLLLEKKLQIGFSESCTGGLLSHKITNIPGSSAYFKGSVISYANEIKTSLLEVSEDALQTEGAVSEATVRQMANHARKLLEVDIALAVSGILGPDGGSSEKPVGTVWMAIADEEKTEARLFKFRYDRLQNKECAANAALAWLMIWLKQKA